MKGVVHGRTKIYIFVHTIEVSICLDISRKIYYQFLAQNLGGQLICKPLNVSPKNE
jgi:hypothetical protein